MKKSLGKLAIFYRSIFLSQGSHLVREGLRLALNNLGYIIGSLALVVFTMLLIGGAGSFLRAESIWHTGIISLLFLFILLEIMVAGAGYFVLWIRFIRSDREKTPNPYKPFRALGISCIGVLPNVGLFFLLPYLGPMLFPADNDSCGGIVVALLAYLIFFLSAVIMPLVGTMTGMRRTPPQMTS